MRSRPRALSAALAAALVACLAACSSDDGSTAADDGDGRLSVVASTNVWGDVVAQVGGDLVDVESIIDDPSVDPHSYEGSARVQLALSRADLVVVNGGGYDDFAVALVDALAQQPATIDAVDVSGLEEPADGELNEHVWYDLTTVQRVADEIAVRLGELDPADAATFTANARDLRERIDALIDRADDIADAHGGAQIAVTEPVPLYLTAASGLVDGTPPEFSEAIEEEIDVAPGVMAQMLDLVASPDLAFLVYNEQTTGPQTDEVVAAAQAADLPVVRVTETLPEGEDYVTWMAGNLEAFAQALA